MYTSCTLWCTGLFRTNSAQEQEIVEHPSSCYVIGRSGTGKTTTMLFKMLSIERTWQKYRDIGPKPRQVFITQSRVLATKVQEYFDKLMSSHEVSEHSQDGLRTMETDAEQETDLVDLDDDEKWRSDLPDRFSDLLDDHFPLFVTYDRVCILTSRSSKCNISPLGSFAQCCRTILSEAIKMTAWSFPTSMPLETR